MNGPHDLKPWEISVRLAVAPSCWPGCLEAGWPLSVIALVEDVADKSEEWSHASGDVQAAMGERVERWKRLAADAGLVVIRDVAGATIGIHPEALLEHDLVFGHPTGERVSVMLLVDPYCD